MFTRLRAMELAIVAAALGCGGGMGTPDGALASDGNATAHDFAIRDGALDGQSDGLAIVPEDSAVDRTIADVAIDIEETVDLVLDQAGFDASPDSLLPLAQLVGLGGGGFEIASVISAGRLLTAVECGGVRASEDRGETWREASKGVPVYGDIQTFWKDPFTGGILFIGQTGAILRSMDNGDTWVKMAMTSASPVTYRPIADFAALDASTYIAVEGDRRHQYGGPAYATSAQSTGRIWLGSSGGSQWSEGPLVAKNASDDLLSIYVHPVRQDMYVATASAASVALANATGGVRKSSNRGQSWTDYDDGLPARRARRLIGSSTNPDILFLTIQESGAGPSKVFRVDTAATDPWQDITYDLPSDGDFVELATDVVGRLYVANFNGFGGRGGLYTLSGTHWSHLTMGGGVAQNMQHGWLVEAADWTRNSVAASLSIDPVDDKVVYFSTPQRDQRFRSVDRGQSWQQNYANREASGAWRHRGMTLVGSFAIAIDPANSQRILIGYADWTTARSEDGGQSWHVVKNLGAGGSDVNKILFDPDDSRYVWYAAGYREANTAFGVFQSSDGGVTWTAVGGTGADGGVNGLPGGHVRDLAVDWKSPLGARAVYAIVDGQGVYLRSGQSGAWRRIDGPGLPDTTAADWPLRALAIDANRHLVYVGFEVKGGGTGGIFRTANDGTSWEPVTGASPLPENKSVARTLVVNPVTGDLYVGAAGGAYRLRLGSQTWEELVVDPKIKGLALVAGATSAEDTVYISGEKTIAKWRNGVLVDLFPRLPLAVFRRGEGIAYDAASRLLYVSIQCGGVYRITDP